MNTHFALNFQVSLGLCYSISYFYIWIGAEKTGILWCVPQQIFQKASARPGWGNSALFSPKGTHPFIHQLECDGNKCGLSHSATGVLCTLMKSTKTWKIACDTVGGLWGPGWVLPKVLLVLEASFNSLTIARICPLGCSRFKGALSQNFLVCTESWGVRYESQGITQIVIKKNKNMSQNIWKCFNLSEVYLRVIKHIPR